MKGSHFSVSSAQSWKVQGAQDQQNTTTYRFDSSHISNSSTNSSYIQNFGKEDVDFPEPVAKPNFGFRKKEPVY